MRIAVSLNLIVFCALLLGTRLLADEPLPPPEKMTAWSEDHGYFAESVPNGETNLYRMPDRKALWKMPGWHRSVFVSDTGVVAIGYEGINLLPLNYRSDLVLIELWHDGRMTHQMRVRELVRNPKLLQRTVSHYYWGYIIGFNKNNQLEVVTVERKVLIDPEKWEHPKAASLHREKNPR